MNIFKKRKAQQLVEFLLIAPFLVIMLGIVTEYAYALNVNMTLESGIKKVTASIYSKIKPNMDESEIKNLVLTDLTEYLASNNVATNSENNISILVNSEGDTTVFAASYRYYSAFTLPNMFFYILPEQFNFLATSAVPTAFLKGNQGYLGGSDSVQLDKIWSSGADFSSLDSFNASKKGILTTNSSSMPFISTGILFLVPETEGSSNYYLVSWLGDVLSNCLFSSASGNLSGMGCGLGYSGQPFLRYLKDKNYYNVFFVHDESMPLSITTADVKPSWIIGSGKLSDTNVKGILKSSVAMINVNSKPIGNFDNINSSLYNGGLPATSYRVYAYGSIVFVYSTSLDSISQIAGSTTEASYGHSF